MRGGRGTSATYLSSSTIRRAPIEAWLITFTQLRSFLAVLRTGSVTGAAEELVVTQPSVSKPLSPPSLVSGWASS